MLYNIAGKNSCILIQIIDAWADINEDVFGLILLVVGVYSWCYV